MILITSLHTTSQILFFQVKPGMEPLNVKAHSLWQTESVPKKIIHTQIFGQAWSIRLKDVFEFRTIVENSKGLRQCCQMTQICGVFFHADSLRTAKYLEFIFMLGSKSSFFKQLVLPPTYSRPLLSSFDR